jgi:hypothetical protein
MLSLELKASHKPNPRVRKCLISGETSHRKSKKSNKSEKSKMSNRLTAELAVKVGRSRIREFQARRRELPVQRLVNQGFSALFILVRVSGRRSEARICKLCVQQRSSRSQRMAELSLQRQAAGLAARCWQKNKHLELQTSTLMVRWSTRQR